MSKNKLVWSVLLIATAFLTIPAGAQGPAVDVDPESCVTCHDNAGTAHQASYDELYQDGVIQVTDLAYSFSAPDTSTITFKMTKKGVPIDARDVESLGIYFVPYTGTAFQFEPGGGRLSLKGTLTYDGAGGCTSTKSGTLDVTAVDGLIVVYGRDESVGRLPARVYQNRYPFAALLETGGGVDYVSAANNAGCVKCHTDPYLKHGYIYAQVNQDAATDFYTCKACHLDNGEGGHFEWQLLVDDPEKAVEWLHSEDLSIFTPEQLAQLAYETSLMNDVHMSHAMEFPYPQSMANCVTCHEGKLDTVLSDDNFNVKTCKSCHPVTGSEAHGTAELALKTLLSSPMHDDMDLETEDCAMCHSVEGDMGPVFSDIHTGYDKAIYAAADLKYSDAMVVTIDSASVADNKLTIQFSATETTDLPGIDAADIVPTMMVGLYGWDTKDFIIGPHERDADRVRYLEAEVGLPDAGHPRITTVSASGGSWEVTADLSMWADLIDNGSVKRVEIAVMPELTDGAGVTFALDAPNRTFDLLANAFDDGYFNPIVDVEKCHTCHDALATNYHSPDRGGSIVTCRMCHITKSRGSHLEMQSRSLDSYVHAIHSGQAFDIGDVNFADPVEALHYEHHIGFPYPTHGITNCESCHNPGTYDVPDQSKSLPGILSASDTLQGWDRNIGDVPLVITGPGARACGACHRAELINEDNASGLVSFNQHTKQGGYRVEGGDDSAGVLDEVINYIMALFK